MPFEADGEDEFDSSAAEPQAKKQKGSKPDPNEPSQQEDIDDADEVWQCLPFTS